MLEAGGDRVFGGEDCGFLKQHPFTLSALVTFAMYSLWLRFTLWELFLVIHSFER